MNKRESRLSRRIVWLAMVCLCLMSTNVFAGLKDEFFAAVRDGDVDKTARLLSAYPGLANASDLVPALHWAAMEDNARLVKLLINRGADVRSTDQYRITPLHWAAIGSSPDVLNLLINKGANVNAKDKWGFTPLHWVAKCNADHTIADVLVARGARTEARDYQGRTPLHLAAIYGNAAAIEMLAKNGANVNARDRLRRHSSALCGIQIEARR